MVDIEKLLEKAVKDGASDIFISVGIPPALKISGEIIRLEGDILKPDDTERLVRGLFNSEEEYKTYRAEGERDFSASRAGLGRFRVSAYTQRGTSASVIRVIRFEKLNIEKLRIPDEVMRFHKLKKGLVLVTGSTGTGKSTTLSALIDMINRNYNYHILTLEDPIEYLHKHEKSIVNQREIGIDTANYQVGLRSALRESPNVIFIGEMRDYETMEIALTAAETGHLVMSTLHTTSAPITIDRIIDVFPPQQQQQVRVQLALTLKAVFSQQLVKTLDNKLVPAFEVMVATVGVRNMIRDNRIHQIDGAIQTGIDEGMLTMDMSLAKLFNNGIISREVAEDACRDIKMLSKYIDMKMK